MKTRDIDHSYLTGILLGTLWRSDVVKDATIVGDDNVIDVVLAMPDHGEGSQEIRMRVMVVQDDSGEEEG